eukprot:Hpha_TRINITY_DN15597_c4_g5::TRINITY_DN15597_c4_g5_i1::g.108428::m.108428/K20398/LAMTOR2; ragulator complex protein LAMTOR2
MLRAHVLPEVLAQVLGGGVHTAILMTVEGEVIGIKSTKEQSGPDVEMRVSTVIEISSLWAHYSQMVAAINSVSDGEEERVRCAIVDSDDRSLCLTEVVPRELLACLVAESSAQKGMLRRKARVLQEHLQGPMTRVFEQLPPEQDPTSNGL